MSKGGGASGATPNNAPMSDDQFSSWSGGKGTPVSTPTPITGKNAPNSGIIGDAVSSLASTTVQNMKSGYQSSANAIGSDVKNAAGSIGQAGQDLGSDNVGGALANTGKAVVQGGLGTLSDAISYFLTPLSAAIKTVTDTVSGTNPNAQGISGIPAVQKLATGSVGNTVQGAQDALTQAAQAHPVLAKALTDAFNVAMTAAGGTKAPEAVDILGQGAKRDASAISNAVTGVTDKVGDVASGVKNKIGSMVPEMKPVDITSDMVAKSDQSILDSFNKGVKPSVSGKGTSGKIDLYNSKVVDAVKTIAQNKNSLSITDEFGDATGKLPTNPRQFGQAIEQTKQQIFNQYDALAKDAGEKGATVDLKPAVSELNKLASDKVVNDLHPELAKYALERATALKARGTYTTSEAQTAVQNLNRSLESFYKNPSYDTASKASVDAMIANNLRTGLDTAITDVKGSGYAELKGKYASLKAIEADVNKRAQIVARKTTGGLSFGDVFSAEEVIRGLSTMNPTAIATGVGVKAATTLWKYFNNPDRYIANMFQAADRATSMGKTTSLPTSVLEQSK